MANQSRGFIPILARHRSGTTALRDIMGRHPRLVTYAEVFHPDRADKPAFFYYFWKSYLGENPEHHWPSPQNREALFDAYLQHLDHVATAGKTVTFNVNYNSLHALDHYWRDLLGMPFLVSLIRKRKLPVIHLIRKNVLATHISELRARKTGVWHSKSEADPKARIKVACGPLQNELNWRTAEIRRVTEWLQGLLVLELCYEELFNGARLTTESVSRIARFLGVSPEPLHTEQVRFKRTGPQTLDDAVANPEEVREALKGSPYEAMLDQL